MSTKSSVATDMAWNWVIQSLAKFKQVDSSTSLGLVKKAPAISDDMGKDAREMVALQVLEDLFDNESDATVDVGSATNAKVLFDLSENCEDVLYRILGEASEPMTDSEKQNYNVRPFILHKRAYLPKSPLQKFKEKLLEDNHPLPTSLKEMSRLGVDHETEVTIPNVDISANDQTTVVDDDLTSPNSANENEKLQESPLQKSGHVENSIEHEVSVEQPVKGLEENTLMEHVQQTNGDADYRQEQPCDDDDNVHEDAYREGHDKRVQINGKLQEESPLQKPDHTESSEHTVSDHVENSIEHEVSIESHVTGLEENTLMDHVEQINDDTDDRQEQPLGDDNNVHQGAYRKARDKRVQINRELQESPLQKSDHVENSLEHEVSDHVENYIEHEVSVEPSVKGLEENTLMDHIEQTNNDTDDQQEQPRGDDDNVHQDTCRKRQDKRVQIDIQPNDGNQVETCSDREGSEDERTDIAARKEAFFSSQGTLSQDFMATIDCSELCICMKCSNGGEVLVCSSDACPFRVHESCLGSAAAFDDNGNFFCPFCACSNAISKYLEGKKKASLARKQFQAFLSSGVKRRPNISHKKDACLDKNESRQRAPDENVEVNNNRGKKSCAPEEASTSSRHHVRRQPITKPILHDNENGTVVPSVSGHSKRRRKSGPQYASPSLTLARRKNLQWTKLEEDTLKEAMQKFSIDNDKKIPWKDILDFGRGVFDKRRTTIDLKDKWRNLCKEKTATKKQKL